MESHEIERLKYRRQYLLTPEPIQCPFRYEIRKITDHYNLYTHIDLKVEECSLGSVKLLLLGDIFDFENPGKSNLEILHDLINDDIENVLESSSKYSGRFVFVYIQSGLIYLFHDATAARKVFYCKRNSDYWFGSQPHLLARVLNLSKTNDASKLNYYLSNDFVRSLNGSVGDTTIFDEISQLLPNHFIRVNNFKIERYWPNKVLETRPIKAIAGIAAKMLKGYVESIALRYEIMLPLTAGKDSRTLLAAAYNIKDQVYIYLNKHFKLSDESPDIAIPKKLLSKLNLNFNVIDQFKPVDEDFREIYFENNPFASPEHLPIIYNYYINFPGKVNLPGNNVAEQQYIFNIVTKELNPGDLTELTGLGNYDFANKYFLKWFSDAKEICLKYHVNPMSLFYWEHRLTNCILQYQIDKDIAQEEFSPFNSRQLISHYLAAKPKHLLPPDYKLHKKVMKNLWPDVLKVPINPSLRNSLKIFIKMLGLLKIVYRVKYSLKHSL